MKYVLTFFYFFISLQNVFSQNTEVDFSKPPPNMDSLFTKIALEKNDSIRFRQEDFYA